MSGNGFNFNKMRKFEHKVGGAMTVYGLKADITMPTGYSVDLATLPEKGNVLPAGTPFAVDDLTKVAQIHYAFKVHSPAASGASTVQVFKGFEGTRAKVGMKIGLYTYDATTILAPLFNSAYITAIDSSNVAFDILTIDADLPEMEQGDILIEVGEDNIIKVIPTATSYADIPVYGDEEHQSVDLVHVCNVIYTRRIPPIHNRIREYMNANGYFVRFYDGE